MKIYLKEVFSEFNKIRWLTFKRSVLLGILVISVSAVSGFLLGFFDNVLGGLLGGLIL